MVSTSGSRLLPEDAVKVLINELLPVAGLLTPNIPEALLLLRESGRGNPGDVENLEGMKILATSIASLGPKNVLIKGGHLPLTKGYKAAKSDEEKQVLVNVLYSEGEFTIFESDYQISRNTHGTGCSLACKSQVCEEIRGPMLIST